MKLVHPSALSDFAKYRQVKALLKQTNRASNSDWYRGPLSLDAQLHIYLSNSEFDQWVLHIGSEKKCKLIPSLPESSLSNPAELQSWLEQFIQSELPKKAQSLGIIIYLADEFTLTELASGFQDYDAVKEVRDDVQYDPVTVMKDRTLQVDERSWRIFPYAGTGGNIPSGVAVSVSRRYQPFVQALRDAGEVLNFPVVVEALSAPLVALSLIPKVITPGAERAFVCILQYTEYSVLSFFSPAGNLVQLRTLRHRGKDFPPNIVTSLSTTASGLGLGNATYHVLPMAGRAASKNMMELIFEQAPEMKPAQARMGLRLTDDEKHIRPEIAKFLPSEEEEKASLSPATKLTSAVSLTRKWVLQASGAGAVDIENSTTFKNLTIDGWHLQDFLPPTLEEIEILPSQQDIKLFKIGSLLKKIAAVLLLGFGVLTGWSYFKAKSDEAWLANPAPLVAQKNAFAEKIKLYDTYNTLFQDRSRAWAAMELVAQMFPQSTVLQLDKIDFKIATKELKSPKRSEFIRTWNINGVAQSSALRDLTVLNTKEGIEKVFNRTAKVTKDASYLMKDKEERSIDVNVERSTSARNQNFDLSFSIIVEQIFSEEDDLIKGLKNIK